MVLADRDIREKIKTKELVIRPFADDCVQPSSVDLHLGGEFLVFDSHAHSLIDIRKNVNGLVIHSTAGYVDSGFAGQLTLEISNLANLPIAVDKGMKICQISFMRMTSPAQYPYGHKKLNSHYQDQKGVTGAKFNKK